MIQTTIPETARMAMGHLSTIAESYNRTHIFRPLETKDLAAMLKVIETLASIDQVLCAALGTMFAAADRLDALTKGSTPMPAPIFSELLDVADLIRPQITSKEANDAGAASH